MYRRAARRFLEATSKLQFHATLHWVQSQAISLDHVLGDPQDAGAWWTGFRSATIELEDSEEPYWSHGSLAELWLLKLFDDLSDEDRKEAREKALRHVGMIRRIVTRDHFAVYSTKRQFNRYVELWGPPEFSERLDLERSPHWDGELGVVAVARELVSALES